MTYTTIILTLHVHTAIMMIIMGVAVSMTVTMVTVTMATVAVWATTVWVRMSESKDTH